MSPMFKLTIFSIKKIKIVQIRENLLKVFKIRCLHIKIGFKIKSSLTFFLTQLERLVRRNSCCLLTHVTFNGFETSFQITSVFPFSMDFPKRVKGKQTS